MSFELKEPLLIVGLGGTGSKLAKKAATVLKADTLIISHDKNDIDPEYASIFVSTSPVVNPSVPYIRACAHNALESIKEKVSEYATVVLLANLAGKDGTAFSPIISQVCKEENKGVVSFAIMPFKFEKDRLFNAGIALKRLRTNSDCVIVVDNDALLNCNPDLTKTQCNEISNSAVLYGLSLLQSSEIGSEAHILSTEKGNTNLEISVKDSLKMLYENAPPNSVKRSLLYVLGGDNVPVGIINSISNLTAGILSEDGSRVDVTTNSSNETKVVMLSSVRSDAIFEKYDPLGIIPTQNTLDWNEPECSINCELSLYQLE